MKKRMQIILVLLLSVCLLLPSKIVFSQEEDYYMAFAIFWKMSFAVSLDGRDDIDTLRSIRDSYRRDFDDMITEHENNQRYQAADISKVLRGGFMKLLDKRVELAEERARQAKGSPSSVTPVISTVLKDGADAVDENTPAEPNPVIPKILPVLQKQIKQNATDMLYGHIASRIPDSGAAVSSVSSPQIYHTDAGLPPLSAPPIISQDGAENGGNTDANNPLLLKPLRFANAGLFDATVRAFNYTPAEGVTAGMSGASTVVFRDSNPTAYLDLPLGTYVFCYDWDLGTDADKDGYVDYGHKNTVRVILTVQSPDEPNSAQVVTLDPDNNQNGKCGESLSGNADNLTPQELANQGTHTYVMNCVCNGASDLVCDFWGGEYDPSVGIVDFVEGGVKLTNEEGVTTFHQKLGVNTYNYADDLANGRLTFTNEGMIYSGDGLICTALRR